MNRLSIANLLPGLTGRDHDAEGVLDLSEDPTTGESWAPKHGPAKQRWLTSGQVRRMIVRQSATVQRKANGKFRRDWMRNQNLVASLRGQLTVVGVLTSADGQPFTANPDLLANTTKALVDNYGSIDAAYDKWVELVTEAA